MKKVLLMGQANVGKSVLFNRLAGAGAVVSNYPGTTVDFDKGHMMLEGERVEIIDVPGAFSLEPKDRAEEVTLKMLEDEKGATVVCVIDSSKVERGLYLALELIEKGYPVVIDLNMADVAKDANIKVNVERLEDILGVPVVTTVATRGEGMRGLVARIKEAKPIGMEEIIKKVGGG
jgi:ferrous iron transport protein B